MLLVMRHQFGPIFREGHEPILAWHPRFRCIEEARTLPVPRDQFLDRVDFLIGQPDQPFVARMTKLKAIIRLDEGE